MLFDRVITSDTDCEGKTTLVFFSAVVFDLDFTLDKLSEDISILDFVVFVDEVSSFIVVNLVATLDILSEDRTFLIVVLTDGDSIFVVVDCGLTTDRISEDKRSSTFVIVNEGVLCCNVAN